MTQETIDFSFYQNPCSNMSDLLPDFRKRRSGIKFLVTRNRINVSMLKKKLKINVLLIFQAEFLSKDFNIQNVMAVTQSVSQP